MDITALRSVLLWTAILNLGLLTIWFLMIACARHWIYRVHSRWHSLSFEQFSSIHYAGMMGLKIATFLLFVCPYLALCIVQ